MKIIPQKLLNCKVFKTSIYFDKNTSFYKYILLMINKDKHFHLPQILMLKNPAASQSRVKNSASTIFIITSKFILFLKKFQLQCSYKILFIKKKVFYCDCTGYTQKLSPKFIQQKFYKIHKKTTLTYSVIL